MIFDFFFSNQCQCIYTTIDADGGFEVADDNFPTAFTKSGSNAWKLTTPATNDFNSKINISGLNNGIYLLKANSHVELLIICK